MFKNYFFLNWFDNSLLYAQTTQKNSRITQVENGLLADAEMVFVDNFVPRFNIYDGMKFYKVRALKTILLTVALIKEVKYIEGKKEDGVFINLLKQTNIFVKRT